MTKTTSKIQRSTMVNIKDDETTSAYYAGKANRGWVNRVSAAASELLNMAVFHFNRFRNAIGQVWENRNLLLDVDFIMDWIVDDPLGAGAAGALVGVVAGVAIKVGGAIAGLATGALAGAKAVWAAVTGSTVAKVALGASIPNLWAVFVSTSQTIYHFDWNQSDQQIRQQQQAMFLSISAAAGESLGQALGAVTCGAHPGIGTVEVNVELMAELWEVLNEDARDEVADAFTGLLHITFQAGWKLAFLEVFKNARTWIKKNVRTGIGNFDKALEAWGEEGSRPWSFALAVEEAIEQIDDPNVQVFTEEFIESYFESCGQALLVRAYR